MENKLFLYHLHSDYSSCITNIDSVTKVDMYVEKAKECGMSALAFSEHGVPLNWQEKKTKIEKAGMKYVHAVECYVTETLSEKIRDNYHCILIAKNYEGFKEINRLISEATNREDNHYYYYPRVCIDDIITTSENVIITSACLGGIINKGAEGIKDKFLSFLIENRDRCYLEIQHHNFQDQIRYNQYLYELSKKYNLELVAGTDTHSLNEELAEARLVLQKAKNTVFEDEKYFDMTFKTYEELIESYREQNSLPMEVVLKAIDNTKVIESQIEEFEIDTTPKYPELYSNPEEEFEKEVYAAIEKHPYALTNHTKEELIEAVKKELPVYHKTHMESFMLFQKFVRDWEHENGIYVGAGRGSVSGSMIAYLLGITEMDSIKFDLNFFRFANPDRQSNADIDSDYYDPDRFKTRNFLLTCDKIQSAEIAAFGTIALRGAIRDVGRGLGYSLQEVTDICNSLETHEKEEYAPESIRKKYKELFKYVDLLNGVITNVGTHPAGVLCATRDIKSEIGTFTLGTTPHPVSVLDMYGLDAGWWTKLDCLG